MSCSWCERNESWWQAMLYVLGELDAERAEAFERHMEGCQVAREAVAEAVLLVDAVKLTEPGSVVGEIVAPPRRHGLFATWAPTLTGVLSLAVTVLVVAAIAWWAGRERLSIERGPVADLAIRWAALRSLDLDGAVEGVWRSTVHGLEVVEQMEPEGAHLVEPGLETPAEEEVPDWMLVALEALGSEGNGGEETW